MSFESEIKRDFLKLEFSDQNGPVTVGPFTGEMTFDNHEILLIKNTWGNETKDTQNAEGLAFTQAVRKPRSWITGVRTWNPITNAKINALQVIVDEGYTIKAYLLEGYYIYDPATGGNIPATGFGSRGGIIENAVISLNNIPYEEIHRAIGVARFVEFPFIIQTGYKPTAAQPTTGTGIQIVRNPRGGLAVNFAVS